MSATAAIRAHSLFETYASGRDSSQPGVAAAAQAAGRRILDELKAEGIDASPQDLRDAARRKPRRGRPPKPPEPVVCPRCRCTFHVQQGTL